MSKDCYQRMDSMHPDWVLRQYNQTRIAALEKALAEMIEHHGAACPISIRASEALQRHEILPDENLAVMDTA